MDIRNLRLTKKLLYSMTLSLSKYMLHALYIGLALKQTEILKNETIDDKVIYIPNDDDQNYPFCRLEF